MREILSRVLKHLEEAREERDVIKLNCVNEKLTAIKGLLKISEQADVSMQEALARRRHFLSALRRYRPHVLSEPEERLLEEASNTGERAFSRLEAPLRRVTGFDTPFPYTLESHYMPTADRVLFELREVIEY